MKIIINGKDFDFTDGKTIADCLKQFNFDPSKIIVEKNLEIIKKDKWQDEELRENDRLEILRFVGGG